ncbi:MAG: quinol dehydrogenase periplasmic component [candidate division BRC1 bacterium ADurb.BinA364]|nr:MAG: quinol dehydrogenase periplasmic component [candidate division BRC1 bacterium ADurb.BinA364]
MKDKDKILLRRQFFGSLFGKLAEPVVDMVDRKIKHIKRAMPPLTEFSPPPAKTYTPPPAAAPAPAPDPAMERLRLIRPPGALPEEQFLQTCERTGECIEACPASAIRPLESADPERDGTACINPDIQACVWCAEMPCMSACPTGALEIVPRERVRMGLAAPAYRHCLRSEGEDCRACLDACPIGEDAIRIDEYGAIEVNPDHCVGCGMCQMHCPAEPRAIAVYVRDGMRGALSDADAGSDGDARD